MYIIQGFLIQAQSLSAFPNVKAHFFLVVTHLLQASVYLQITGEENLLVIGSILLYGDQVIAKDSLIKQILMFTESL